MLSNLSDVNIPVLMAYGLKDRNVYPQVSEHFFNILKSKDKQIVSFDCNHWFYDAIFFSQSDEYSEGDRQAFLKRIVDWLGGQSEKFEDVR
jgi:dipeptidyl aminopeptidase/acylaminoacyl peptidase